MDRVCGHCGALHFVQERVKNSSRQNPRFGSCCMHGQVSLPALQEPPQALRDLLSHDVARAKQFRQQIRAYNCSLQLASSTLKDSPQDAAGAQQRGLRSVRMHGRMYHRIGPLLPAEGQKRRFAQLWIYDATCDGAASGWLAGWLARSAVFNGSLDVGVLMALQRMLEESNPLVQRVQMAVEIDDGSEEATIVIDARDKDACPQLYEAVTRHMMHGPCGTAAPQAPCMDGGDCTKRFPRDWQDETTVPEDGYPLYRRRNDGRTVSK
ncbi:hypothetical protein ABPG75_010050 [Micractinium tetrahymenae]